MHIIGLPRNEQAANAFAEAHGFQIPRSALAQIQVKGEISEFKRQQAEARSAEQARARHRAAVKASSPSLTSRPAAAAQRMDHHAERQRLERLEAELRAEIRHGNEQLVQEHERAAQASARHDLAMKAIYGSPQSRAEARKEIAMDQQVERKRLEYLAAEAHAWARKNGGR